MSISPIAAKAAPGGGITLGSGLLPRQALFRTRDLEHGRAHMNVALGGEHTVSYLSRERHLDFRHRQAKCDDLRNEASDLSHPLVADLSSPGIDAARQDACD